MKPNDLIFDIERLERRVRGIQKWLDENGRGCQEEQKHTRAGTVERIYWHYGYMVALMDVLRYLGRQITSPDKSEFSSPENIQQPDKYN